MTSYKPDSSHDTGATHIADALDQLLPWLGASGVPGTPQEQASWLEWLVENGGSVYDEGPGYGSRPFTGTGGYWDKPQPSSPPDTVFLGPPAPIVVPPTLPTVPIPTVPVPIEPPYQQPPPYVGPGDKGGGTYPLNPPWQPPDTYLDPGSGQPMPLQPPPVATPQVLPPLDTQFFAGLPGRTAPITDEYGNPVGLTPTRSFYPQLDPWDPYRGQADRSSRRPPIGRVATTSIESQAPTRGAPPSIASQAPAGPRPIASGAPVPYDDPVRRALQMITVGRNTAL